MKYYLLAAAGWMVMGAVTAKGQGIVTGGQSQAMGGIYTVLENPWSAAGNPAGLARLGQFTVNSSYEQVFLMKELGKYAFAASIPNPAGCIGLYASFEGFESYSSETFTLAYGMGFGEVFSVGTGLFYIIRKAGNENPAVHSVSFSIGSRVNVSEKYVFAISVFNPLNIHYKSNEQASLMSVFRIGGGYKPSRTFSLFAEVIKDADYPVAVALACEYNGLDRIYLRGGIRLLPASFSLGAGIRLKKLLIELAAGYHQYLGITPATSLQYCIK